VIAEVARAGIIKLVDHPDRFNLLKIPVQRGIERKRGGRRTAGLGSTGVVVEEWDRRKQRGARGRLEHGP